MCQFGRDDSGRAVEVQPHPSDEDPEVSVLGSQGRQSRDPLEAHASTERGEGAGGVRVLVDIECARTQAADGWAGLAIDEKQVIPTVKPPIGSLRAVARARVDAHVVEGPAMKTRPEGVDRNR